MRSGCDEEFKTVESVIQSAGKTRGVDAFCLAWIKYERQLRKIVAYLVFQSSQLSSADAARVRAAFHSNKGIAHTGFRGAIQRLTGLKLKEVMGERYAVLDNALARSYRAREKLFHGQQTGLGLSREQLFELTRWIEEWCRKLAEVGQRDFGYDGFSGTTSLFKSANDDLIAKIDKSLGKTGWDQFVNRL